MTVTRADDMQHHLDRRRRPAGGHATLRDGEAIRAAVNVGEAGGEVLQIFPMGGGGMAVQQPGFGQEPAVWWAR